MKKYHPLAKADEVNLSGFENDPAVGKYVNQDGLQQLRHYLKVGPYKSYLTGSNKAFIGYLSKVLTRRPVTLIDSTKGHNTANLANVHYSPGPEHENIPNPGVDYSPRGFPVHQGHSLNKAKIVEEFQSHQPRDFPGPLLNGQEGRHPYSGISQNEIESVPHGVGTEYFAPKIYYGFKPVSSPYGNLTTNDFRTFSHNTINTSNYRRRRNLNLQTTENNDVEKSTVDYSDEITRNEQIGKIQKGRNEKETVSKSEPDSSLVEPSNLMKKLMKEEMKEAEEKDKITLGILGISGNDRKINKTLSNSTTDNSLMRVAEEFFDAALTNMADMVQTVTTRGNLFIADFQLAVAKIANLTATVVKERLRAGISPVIVNSPHVRN